MKLGITVLGMAVLAAACGPPSVRPASYADPEVSCPGGRVTWNLKIVDQRVDLEGSAQMIAAIRDGIQKSFPGCRWAAGPSPDADAISIEVHRFASHMEYDREGTSSWEAAAEWTVRVTNPDGRTLTEFQANEEVSRPNYRGSNNEKESLSEVYQKALERTVMGLRSVPAIGAVRLPEGTIPSEAAAAGAAACVGNSMCARHLPRVALAAGAASRLERKSQPRKA